MAAIVEAISGLADMITGFIEAVIFCVEYLIGMISDLVYMTQLLGEMILQLPAYFGWMPTAVLTNFMLIISIVVIYKVIGREG